MSLTDDIDELERSLKNTKFDRLVVILKKHFEARATKGTSHVLFKVPWSGDPLINVQPTKGQSQAKQYQVEQVLKALRKLQQQQQTSEPKGEET